MFWEKQADEEAFKKKRAEQRNSCQKLGLSVLQELWVAVLDKVYGYEYKWQEDKKLEVGFSNDL